MQNLGHFPCVPPSQLISCTRLELTIIFAYLLGNVLHRQRRSDKKSGIIVTAHHGAHPRKNWVFRTYYLAKSGTIEREIAIVVIINSLLCQEKTIQSEKNVRLNQTT